jgi:SAM-dependent methyltransferase
VDNFYTIPYPWKVIEMASTVLEKSNLESIPCDLCGTSNTQPYLCVRDRIYGLPGEFNLVQCSQCGLLYINPRPDRSSIGAYYPDLEYHAFHASDGIKAKLLDQLRMNNARSLMAGLPKGARILEIGCGTGDLLLALRDLGAEVMGIEPNAAAVKSAREHGLNVEIGMLDDVQLAPAQFDLVLMKYALEHVHSPSETLAAIKKLLKPGGQGVFWVPNAASLDARLFGESWRGLDAPRHLYVFTPDTMRRFMEKIGMQVTAIGYSPVPNDWAGSLEFWLQARGVSGGMARWFGIANPLAMLAWLPFSSLAAVLHTSGRMRVTAVNR